MNKTKILGLVRHVLTTGGGILTANGYVNSSDIESIAGGIVAIIGATWSYFSPEKKNVSGK